MRRGDGVGRERERPPAFGLCGSDLSAIGRDETFAAGPRRGQHLKEPSMDAKHEPMGDNEEACNQEAAEAQPQTEGALALQVEPTAAPVTREQRRSRRKRAVRARTISVKRMTKRELELGRLLYPDEETERPKSRADCVEGARPCPFVSCQHHLYLDVSARTGAIKVNFPDLDVWEMSETCALDVADRGGTTLEEVGAIMNLTRERIRQVEVKGLAKLAALRDMLALRDYVDEGPTGKRRLPVLTTERPEEDDEEAEVEADADDEVDVADVPVSADLEIE
jgi:hypothetical protein